MKNDDTRPDVACDRDHDGDRAHLRYLLGDLPMKRKLITPQPIMQLARVLARTDGMLKDITDNNLVEFGYVAMARAAFDHLQPTVDGEPIPEAFKADPEG